MCQMPWYTQRCWYQHMGTITKIPANEFPPPHMQESLSHINYYTYDVISVVQGGTRRQHLYLTAQYVTSSVYFHH